MSLDNQLADLKIDTYIKTALDIANYFDDQEERHKILNDLSGIVELNCKLKEKLKFVPKKSQEIINNYTSLDDDQINYEEVAKKLSDELESYEPDMSQNNDFKVFKESVKSSLRNDQDDDDFTVTGEEFTVIDPFTKIRIQEPVKNRCGHVYDLASVTAVVKANSKTRCPIMGCKTKEYIDLSHLQIDVVTKAYLKRYPA